MRVSPCLYLTGASPSQHDVIIFPMLCSTSLRWFWLVIRTSRSCKDAKDNEQERQQKGSLVSRGQAWPPEHSVQLRTGTERKALVCHYNFRVDLSCFRAVSLAKLHTAHVLLT